MGQGSLLWGTERPAHGERHPHKNPLKVVDAFFKKHDVNGDGFVDFKEFQAGERAKELDEKVQQKIFNRFDKNEDGKLERREMVDVKKARGSGGERDFFRKLDTNHDKKVSFAEFKANERMKKLDEAKVREIFDRMDRNRDGVLDRQDRPPRSRPGSKQGSEPIDREEFGKVPWHQKLSKEEIDRRFAEMDKNGDGKLEKSELNWPKHSPRDGDKSPAAEEKQQKSNAPTESQGE